MIGCRRLPHASLKANAKRRLAGSIAIKPNFFAFPSSGPTDTRGWPHYAAL